MSCLLLVSTIATRAESLSYPRIGCAGLCHTASTIVQAASGTAWSCQPFTGAGDLCSYEVQAQQQLPWWREEWKCALCGHVATTEGAMDHHMDGEHQDRLVQVPRSTSAPQCLPHPACLRDCVAEAGGAVTGLQ